MQRNILSVGLDTLRETSDYPRACSCADRRGGWWKRWHVPATPGLWQCRPRGTTHSSPPSPAANAHTARPLQSLCPFQAHIPDDVAVDGARLQMLIQSALCDCSSRDGRGRRPLSGSLPSSPPPCFAIARYSSINRWAVWCIGTYRIL